MTQLLFLSHELIGIFLTTVRELGKGVGVDNHYEVILTQCLTYTWQLALHDTDSVNLLKIIPCCLQVDVIPLTKLLDRLSYEDDLGLLPGHGCHTVKAFPSKSFN